MKTNAQHTPILGDDKPPNHAGGDTSNGHLSPLNAALAAVSENCGQGGPGVDLDIYLAAVDAGRSHTEALTIAKTIFGNCAA